MKGHGGSEQYQHTARGHGTSWSRYHRCLAESHDLPALSRLHHFRPVDVRLPHQHAVRPAVDFGPHVIREDSAQARVRRTLLLRLSESLWHGFREGAFVGAVRRTIGCI